jgi:YVTN family beta-propeller protein
MLGVITMSACAPSIPTTTIIPPTTIQIPPISTSIPLPTQQRMTATPGTMTEDGNYLQGWAPGNLGLAISPDGKTAYVSFSLDDALLVVDLATLTITDSVDVSAAGIQINSASALMTLDGKKLYVSNPGAKNVMVVDTRNNKVTEVLPLTPDYSVALVESPDGTKVYIPSVNGGLYVVNTTDDSYQQIFIPGVLFGPIAPSRKDPNLLFTVGALTSNPGNTFQSTFFAFNIATQTVERSQTLPGEVIQFPTYPVRLALNTNETAAYFGWSQPGPADKWIGNLVTFDLDNFQVLTSAPADYGVSDFVVNEPSGRIYVVGLWAGGGSPNNVPILEWDMSTNKFVRNIPLSPSSDQRAIAFDPTNPDFLYETDGDHNILRKVQISTGNEVGRVTFNTASIRPYAIIRGGNTGYIVSQSTQDIFKLDMGSGQLIDKITVPVPFSGGGFYQDKLYVSSGSDILTVNPSDGSIIQRYPIGWNINPISFTFFGDRMAAIDFDDYMNAKQLVIFDARTLALLKTVPLPNEPHGDMVVASPDGSKLYIVRGPVFGGTTVITIINGATLEEITTLKIPPADQRFGATGFLEGEFDEENRILYLLGFESVYKIDMDTDKLIGTLDLVDIFDAWGRRGWTPTGLSGIALSPINDKLFIIAGDSHSIYTYDISSSSWSIKITNLRGYFNTDSVKSPDKHYLFTANLKSDSLTMVDLTTGNVVKVIDLHSYTPGP